MSSPLRIAFVVAPLTLRVKGGRHAPRLAREWLGRGHEVATFGDPSGRMPRSSETGGGNGANGICSFRPDVVVAYGALSTAAFLAARAARKAGAALVLVEPGSSGEPGGLGETLRRTRDRLFGPLIRSTAQAVIALDPFAREEVIRQGFDGERVRIVPPGVDLERYRPGLSTPWFARHRIRGRVVLYVGRIGPGRGLETLIRAFAATLGQSLDWSLVLAGDGPDGAALRLLADRQGVGANVHLLPRPRAEEVPGLLGSSSLLVVPAQTHAVRGQQIPRAMACGLGVLASDLPRLRALVIPEESGLLLPPGDLSAWAAGLDRVGSSPTLRRRFGQRARELALERHGWDRISERCEEIVLDALRRAELDRGTKSAEAG